MATHSSVLAWRIPGTEKPGGLPSMDGVSQSDTTEVTAAAASLGAQMVKNLPAMGETQVQSLGQKDLLKKEMVTHSRILSWTIPWTEEHCRLLGVHFHAMEKEMATHSSILAWRIPGTEKPGGLLSIGSQ